jgi:hypothetical protein
MQYIDTNGRCTNINETVYIPFYVTFMKGDLLMADPATSTRTPEKKSRITSTLAKFQLPKALYIVILPVTVVAPRPTPNIPQLSAILSCDSAVDKTGTTNIYVFSVFHVTLFLSTCIILSYQTSDWEAELNHKKWLYYYKETVFEKSVITLNIQVTIFDIMKLEVHALN